MPTVALALEDFVPVILTAIGLAFVTRTISRTDRGAGRWAAMGTLLIVTGGLSRAGWKLTLAAGGPDLVPLFLALYLFLATGYLLLASALWHGWQATSGRRAGVPVWLPALLAVAILGPLTAALAPTGGRLLPLLWLLAATAGSIVASLVLARWARGIGRPGLGWLFIVSLLVTVALNGLARAENQSEALQWVEQLLNTVNQGVFLVGAVGLERATRLRTADARGTTDPPIAKVAAAEAQMAADD